MKERQSMKTSVRAIERKRKRWDVVVLYAHDEREGGNMSSTTSDLRKHPLKRRILYQSRPTCGVCLHAPELIEVDTHKVYDMRTHT